MEEEAPNTGFENARTASDTPLTTPATTASSSPMILPKGQISGARASSRQRAATTLDIPGLTRSRASPDGRISQRDVGSKLVIVMVGLPARGKSYITKKIARYLNWLQHDTRIFNVGEKRRCMTSGPVTSNKSGVHEIRPRTASSSWAPSDLNDDASRPTSPVPNRRALVPGALLSKQSSNDPSDQENKSYAQTLANHHSAGTLVQTASFFDPTNEVASILREAVAMETLDELLDYIMDQGGSVGIFDATNSTLKRRKAVTDRIRRRAGPDLGILFLESLCLDESLLESNMRLKLLGPDYRNQDPVAALADFRKRVQMYEKTYVSLGEYEERNNMSYVQMIDVGRKVVSHQIRGFLSAQTIYYLLNFNLAPRQIWITRHGESLDNLKGKIGGDSDLSVKGLAYAKALNAFIQFERQAWEVRQQGKISSTHFPPRAGDTTPPNPEYIYGQSQQQAPKNFCVWSSMLKRSIQTAQFFNENEFDVKQMKMLDELNAGTMEGLTYEEIKQRFGAEYRLRKQDKLHYRYPGAGGEGYLDIINRLRAVIVEVERMTDHVLLVGHRSVARVLLAYFRGLEREEVADLDVPLGMLYMLEPKPYGVDFMAYKYNPRNDWFDLVPKFELRRAPISAGN